ncbi:MAG: chemotaxis protein CheB [Acidobacteria bacterium]|nr:MAG: chemotaxis protein CheB [Acidobacteriota bacterium]
MRSTNADDPSRKPARDVKNGKRKLKRVPGRAATRYYDVVAIGASAGGLNALTELLRPISGDFPAILVVQHLDPTHESHMAELLSRRTRIHVKQAEHGEAILPGSVYIAPPDEHLLVGPGTVQLAHSQLVHFSRPSIDLMFESVAGMYGSRSIGVILSGSNRDGSVGIRTIKEAGGTTIAQEPATAHFATMPQAAISTGCVDFVVPIGEIGNLLRDLCAGKRQRHE